jgi:hypothetical protein
MSTEEKPACKHCGSQVYLKGGYCSKAACLKVRGGRPIRSQKSEMADAFHHSQFEYFFSLVQPKPKEIKKPCLRCRRIFTFRDRGNRICAECHQVNERVGVYAIYGI